MKVKVDVVLKDENNLVVRKANKLLDLEGNYTATVSEEMEVVEPQLWSPWSPSLYNVEVTITDINNNPIDGVAVKIGLRKIEFKGKEGFFLNNEPYPGKLMGVNRHQDHAVVGNAMSNNSQWRDAKLLKDAGCDIVRAAHYPVDPAFMDACDALGLFYIVATPGWQFWNKKPIFEKRVLQDIRNMVRRDRNHPCVIMWEPILNETWYPESFAKKTHNAVHEEYPFQGAYTVCDAHARGQKNFDIIYSHPFKDEFFKNVKENTKDNRLKLSYDYAKEERCVFTREWGDCVDDWNSHNSPSRAARDWGERAQLTQAIHYSNSSYVYTNWESLHNTPSQHVGGTLWHSFDHQRGYHPDPFYGGITDDFRQPKYSYFMFASQKDVSNENLAMVYIAHEMTPFSEPDVTVFSNCEEVRLIIYEQDTIVKNVSNYNLKMPHPVVIFEDVFNFIDVKNLHRAKMQSKASLIAEGLIDGKVVTTFKRMPAKRPSKVVLSIENNNVPLLANGSDFVRVVASITDEDGNIKRLNESDIRFEIEGEGSLIGNSSTFTNPRKVRWGTAPILVQSSLSSGKIKVKASVVDEGINSPLAGELEFESLESSTPFIYKEVGKESYQEINISGDNQTNFEFQSKIKQLEKTINNYRLKEVERQQQEFEGGQNK